MRISDWSSDVCSSDLNRPSSRFLAHKLLDIAPECFKRRHDTSRRLAGGRDVSGNRERHGFNGSLVVSPVLAKRPHGDKVRFLFNQLGNPFGAFTFGRASGRESVWQYVLISVVA